MSVVASATCEYCGGRPDYPGLFGCRRKPHPKPTLAQSIIAKLEFDLSDRRGIGQEWQSIDQETQYAIRDAWAQIVESELTKGE